MESSFFRKGDVVEFGEYSGGMIWNRGRVFTLNETAYWILSNLDRLPIGSLPQEATAVLDRLMNLGLIEDASDSDSEKKIVVVRFATVKDAKAIDDLLRELHQLERQFDRDPVSPKSTLGPDFDGSRKSIMLQAIKGGPWIVGVATVGERIVGVCRGWTHDYSKDQAWLGQLFVSPMFRRRGYGKRLVRWFATECKSSGVDTIVIPILHENRDAARYFRSLGATDSIVEYEVGVEEIFSRTPTPS